MRRCRLSLAIPCLILGLAFLADTSQAQQQILLDKPVRAGELIVFPSLSDQNVYYYVSDKPSLSTDDRGRPQFSLLRYVENVRSGAAEDELREGEGGGIVHAVVALAVSDEQLRDAQRQLQRVRPGSRIEGPVVFNAGTFGLVSSFTDPEGNLARRVVGLGNAPLLDGEKAAVSMQLTKLGAKVLWESFHTATPDVSFTFEMDIDGYMSPKRAVIEADFDQIYEHKSFGAGVASTYLAAEVRAAFDDLYRQGAIKLTQVGDDEQLEALITTAYNKIAEMMFQPLQGTGTPDLASLAGAGGGQPGLLDRATSLLASGREDARHQNERIRREQERREAASRRRAESGSGTSAAAPGGTQAPPPPPAAGGEGQGDAQGGAQGEGGTRSTIASRRQGVRTPAAEEATREPRSHGEASAEEASQARDREVAEPSFAIVATFEMKRVRQRGKFTIDLNKYTTNSLTLRFDENIGDLRQYLDDPAHFHQVNLDDPLYRQRELVAFVDGLNAGDFGDYINFVTVHMRKRHEKGDETHDEVRIDRNNFSREGNAFKLLYGWKGDDDRRRWMSYDYRADWSFFGGYNVESPWQTTTSGAINLAPPYQRREVTLEADPDVLGDAGVRSITVKLFYTLGEQEVVQQKTLNPSKGQLSEKVDLVLGKDQFEYQYEISWRLRSNRTLSSGRQTSSEAILFVDELPES